MPLPHQYHILNRPEIISSVKSIFRGWGLVIILGYCASHLRRPCEGRRARVPTGTIGGRQGRHVPIGCPGGKCLPGAGVPRFLRAAAMSASNWSRKRSANSLRTSTMRSGWLSGTSPVRCMVWSMTWVHLLTQNLRRRHMIWALSRQLLPPLLKTDLGGAVSGNRTCQISIHCSSGGFVLLEGSLACRVMLFHCCGETQLL